MATYGEAQTTYGIEGQIPIFYPEDRAGLIYSAIFWGDVAAEYVMYINGTIVGGGRTSEANRTLQIDYTAAPIPVNLGDKLVITGTHYQTGLRTLKVMILTRGT